MLISIGTLLGAFVVWIALFVYEYRQTSQQSLENWLEMQRQSLYTETRMLASLYREHATDEERNLKASMRSWLVQAVQGIDSHQNQDSAALLQDLSKLQFGSFGRGVFAYNSRGQLLLDKRSPSSNPSPLDSRILRHRSSVVRLQTQLMQTSSEQFFTYRWPYAGNDGLATAFLKKMENWPVYVGVSFYQNEIDSILQQEFLNHHSLMADRHDAFALLLDSLGRPLGNTAYPLDAPAMQKTCSTLVYHNGGFAQVGNFLLYLQPLGQWNWYVGIGKQLDEMQRMADRQHAAFKQQLFRFIMGAGLLLLIVLPLAFILSLRHTRRLQQNLDIVLESFQHAENTLIPIEPDSLGIEEFQRIAISANHLMEARSAIEADREKLLKEIEDRSQEFEHILYIASHDLRAPLVNLKGFAGELRHDMGECIQHLRLEQPPPAEIWSEMREKYGTVQESLAYIDKSTARMDRILQGLLAYSRVGRIQPNSQIVSVAQLFEEQIVHLEFRLRELSADIKIGKLPTCYADPLLLQQVIQNLLDNALKYCIPGTPPVIRISGEVDGDRSIYRIQDFGMGIEPMHLPKLFDLFYRIAPEGSTEGSGLGLALVQRMIRRMHGRISVMSEPRKGTIFEIDLPRRKE